MQNENSVSRDAWAALGQSLYLNQVQPQLKPEDKDKIVAIDIDTGNFEVDVNGYSAGEKLRARCPDARIWLERVGHRAAYRIPRLRRGVTPLWMAKRMPTSKPYSV